MRVPFRETFKLIEGDQLLLEIRRECRTGGD